MADYRPQASVYCEWDPYASQSKGNFPQLFSHHVDNQALIAGNIARHFPTVTRKKNKKQKKKQPMAWAIIHKYPTMNVCSE